jgi:murein tripeptide amidase MpaA
LAADARHLPHCRARSTQFHHEIVLVIDYTFKNAEDVYICLTVPFSYSQNEQYLAELPGRIHGNIRYSDEVVAVTGEGRKVHLVTVGEGGEEGKPVVVVTARVHPGEVSSSWCVQGMLELLLSYNNLQAYLLRRLFLFKIVPMLNPDGVAAGNYRMDPQGFNLNRFYADPTPHQY